MQSRLRRGCAFYETNMNQRGMALSLNVCLHSIATFTIRVAPRSSSYLPMDDILPPPSTKILLHYALKEKDIERVYGCLLYTSPSPRDRQKSRMPSSA